MTTILCQIYFDGTTAYYTVDNLVFKSSISTVTEGRNEEGHKTTLLKRTPLERVDALPNNSSLAMEMSVRYLPDDNLSHEQIRDTLAALIVSGRVISQNERFQVTQAEIARS